MPPSQRRPHEVSAAHHTLRAMRTTPHGLDRWDIRVLDLVSRCGGPVLHEE